MDSNKPQKIVLAGVALLALGAGAYWLGSRQRDIAPQSDTVTLGPRRVRTDQPEVVKDKPVRKRDQPKERVRPSGRRPERPEVKPKESRRPQTTERKKHVKKKKIPPQG